MILDDNTVITIGISVVLLIVTYVVLFPSSSSSNGGSSAKESESDGGQEILVDAGLVKQYELNSINEIDVGNTGMKVLLVRTKDGSFFATGSKCTYVYVDSIRHKKCLTSLPANLPPWNPHILYICSI